MNIWLSATFKALWSSFTEDWERKNKSDLKLDYKTSKSYKNEKYDSKHIELFVLTATGGIADLQMEGEQVNREMP